MARTWASHLTPEERELMRKYCGKSWYDWTILMTVRRLLHKLNEKDKAIEHLADGL